MAKLATLSDGKMTEFKRVLAEAGMTAELAETMMSLPDVAREWVSAFAEDFGSCIRIGIFRGEGNASRLEKEFFVPCGRSLTIGAGAFGVEIPESRLPEGFELIEYHDHGWDLCMPRNVAVHMKRVMGEKKDGDKIFSYYDHETIRALYGRCMIVSGRRHLPFLCWTLRLQSGQDSGSIKFGKTHILFEVMKSRFPAVAKKATAA